MEIILAICITGLGIFGGMLVIWNGQNLIPSKAPDTSRTGYSDVWNNRAISAQQLCKEQKASLR